MFRSKRSVMMGNYYEEEEMLKYAGTLIYDTELDIDQVADRFIEAFGDENRHIIEAIIADAEL